MDIVKVIFHGFMLSIGLILPVGPQNMFILMHGMTHGRISENMAVVSAAVLSDSILILLGVGGFSCIVGKAPVIVALLYAFAAMFLWYIGGHLWYREANAIMETKKKTGSPLWSRCMYVFAISIINPQAIFDTVMVIGVASLSYSKGEYKTVFAATCMFTSLFFFTAIMLAGKFINRKLTPDRYKIIDRCSAVLMWIFGIRSFGMFIHEAARIAGIG